MRRGVVGAVMARRARVGPAASARPRPPLRRENAQHAPSRDPHGQSGAYPTHPGAAVRLGTKFHYAPTGAEVERRIHREEA